MRCPYSKYSPGTRAARLALIECERGLRGIEKIFLKYDPRPTYHMRAAAAFWDRMESELQDS